jgi:hypothetical protein
VRRRAADLKPAVPTRRRQWRRRTIVAIAIAALVVAGTATAVERYLLGTSSFTVVPVSSGSTVRGLEGMDVLLPVSDEPSPTAAQCAAAWNEQAPDETRRWAAAQQVAGANVGAGRMRGAGFRVGTSCQVRLLLDDGRVALAQGPWTPAGVPRWRGTFLPIPAASIRPLVRSSNAEVDADGEIECLQRCDARASVPSPTVPAPPPAPSELVPNACTLLTPGELAAAFGRAPRFHKAESGSASSSC